MTLNSLYYAGVALSNYSLTPLIINFSRSFNLSLRHDVAYLCWKCH